MPTYEYECTNCQGVMEIFQSITAKPKRRPNEPCPNCGQRAPIRRLISGGGAVLFKGSGFYQTDYRTEGYKKAAEADKKEPTAATSTDTAAKDAPSKPAEAKKPKKTKEPK